MKKEEKHIFNWKIQYWRENVLIILFIFYFILVISTIKSFYKFYLKKLDFEIDHKEINRLYYNNLFYLFLLIWLIQYKRHSRYTVKMHPFKLYLIKFSFFFLIGTSIIFTFHLLAIFSMRKEFSPKLSFFMIREKKFTNKKIISINIWGKEANGFSFAIRLTRWNKCQNKFFRFVLILKIECILFNLIPSRICTK